MTAWEATVYGVVQGLTEFIPISSNAHLEVTSVALTGQDIGAPFTAVIQWGTWVACVIYFRKDIARFAAAFFRGIWENRPFATQDARLAWMLLVGTVPIGVVGILLKKQIETVLRGLYVIAAAAVVFALLLALAEWVHWMRVRSGKPLKDLSAIGWGETLLVGFAQCFALIPGASRSGTTITGGIFGGMTREAAARFSFLLSLPSVFAAGLYELYKERQHLVEQGIPNLVIATVVAGVVGYASIWFLIRFLKTHSTWVFIGYRVAAGILLAVLVWQGVLHDPPPEPEGRAEILSKFARTFPPGRRLPCMKTGARTVSTAPVFWKSPVTNDEEVGILLVEEDRPSRQVQQDKRGNRETRSEQPQQAGQPWPARPFTLDRRRSVMALFTLRTLVRGVAVVRDGQNVGLRLVAECQPASRQTTEVRINPRHPSHNSGTGGMPASRPDGHADYDRVAAQAATGAGRSLRSDGVLSRRGAARIARPAIPLGWRKPQGSPWSDAKRLAPKAKQQAVGSAAAQARPLPLNVFASVGGGFATRTDKAEERSAVRLDRRMPAGRMRPASTWAS
jgi:undecaprenyl-diphosphatase